MTLGLRAELPRAQAVQLVSGAPAKASRGVGGILPAASGRCPEHTQVPAYSPSRGRGWAAEGCFRRQVCPRKTGVIVTAATSGLQEAD